MPPRNIEDSNHGRHTPAAAQLRLGHRIREIRQQLHHRHPTVAAKYQVTRAHTAPHPPTDPASLLAVTSDAYQVRLYARSRSKDPGQRLAAIREAIATSPYTWEDLTADGVREWVEPSVEDDALLTAAVNSLGDLGPKEGPYLGKFTVERIYEMLTDAEVTYWRKGRPPPAAL